ncbi:hypothetical protein M2277_005051 [Paenibacillus sp. LBL]|nr:hypothetical protein [Paenibacillus sp. LBL]
MEWHKFIKKQVRYCVDNESKKDETKLLISEYLEGYEIKHRWHERTLEIDGTLFEFIFDSTNTCKGLETIYSK